MVRRHSGRNCSRVRPVTSQVCQLISTTSALSAVTLSIRLAEDSATNSSNFCEFFCRLRLSRVFLNMYTQLFEECHHSGDTFSLQRGELEASAELLDDACAFTMKDTTALRALFSGHVEGAPFISFPRTAVAKVPTTSNPSIDLLESLLLPLGPCPPDSHKTRDVDGVRPLRGLFGP